MADENDESLIQYPCEFPIKIMGKTNLSFEATVLGILREHVPDLGEGAISLRHSSEGKFVSITATITATSRQQLDDLYGALNAHDDVLMVL